eukprot:scaffold63399_cov60-Phaeocystis_antarctica.AAC.2
MLLYTLTVLCSPGKLPELPLTPLRVWLVDGINLGTAERFALLAKAGITTTGVTSVTGDIGTSPITGAAMTGFGISLDATGEFSTSTLVEGKLYAADYATPTPAFMTQAISDMEAAYVAAAGRPNPVTVELGAGLIGGMTLTGGVHKWSTVVTVPVGQKLSFDARGDEDTVWIMQIAQGLNFMADSEVVLLDGAKSSNIFWQVAGVATILAGAHAEGNILCATAITTGAGSSLHGRGLAQTAVTMIATTIVAPSPPCLPARYDYKSITCPAMGMLIKSGHLVPSCEDGMVDKEQTLAAMAAKGFPIKIATATTNDNFKGVVCPTCPDRIDPFEMNTVPSLLEMNTVKDGVTSSPENQPHEHFRSTGIREGYEHLFFFAERKCASKNVWDWDAITCMADFWDRDPGCPGAPSNDVHRKKRPAGCCPGLPLDEVCCESTADNAECRSQLHGTIESLFDSFKDPKTNTISSKDWTNMYLNLCAPGDENCL